MKIQKRYRLFYLPLVGMSLLIFSIWRLIQFIIDGHLPANTVDVTIEGFNGKYKKVYIKDGVEYIGEELQRHES